VKQRRGQYIGSPFVKKPHHERGEESQGCVEVAPEEERRQVCRPKEDTYDDHPFESITEHLLEETPKKNLFRERDRKKLIDQRGGSQCYGSTPGGENQPVGHKDGCRCGEAQQDLIQRKNAVYTTPEQKRNYYQIKRYCVVEKPVVCSMRDKEHHKQDSI